MKKYDYELKLKIVKEYLDGKGSSNDLAKKYGPSGGTIRVWVNKYKAGGKDVLKESTIDTSFSVQFKLHAIELYQTTDISYEALAQKLGIKSSSVIEAWIKKYNAKGIKGISRTRSVPNNMTKKNSNKKDDDSFNDLTEEEWKEKVLHLEIENDYLKELWSLRNKKNTNSKMKKNQE